MNEFEMCEANAKAKKSYYGNWTVLRQYATKTELLCPKCVYVRSISPESKFIPRYCERCGEKMFEDGATPYMKKQKEGAARK